MTQTGGPVLVFANGELAAGDWVWATLARAEVVIAADGGLRHLLALARRPDVLIGDLDSLPPGIVAETAPEVAGAIVRYPREKDETDLELALLYAVDRYPEAEVIILGGTGGRLDHLLANVLILAHPRLRGRPIRFLDDRQSAWLVAADAAPGAAGAPGATTIAGAPGDIVSLLPLGGPAHVTATSGLRWPLRDEWLAFGPARGVSNEMTAETATVRLDQGALLCVHIQQ